MVDNTWNKSKQRMFVQERRNFYNENFIQQHARSTNDDFALECLRAHNHFRAQHGCPPLHLSHEVSRFSQQWADRLACEDHSFHSHHPKYGENLFVAYLSDNSLPVTRGNEVVESWYSEHNFYPFNGCVTREIVSKVGHFTQVIWMKSKELGIGQSVSRSNRMYVVANYYPPGNIIKKFSANVPKILDTSRRLYCSSRHYTRSISFRPGFYFDSWIEC